MKNTSFACFLSVVLTVLSIVLFISGILQTGKAIDERSDDIESIDKLHDRINKYENAQTLLSGMMSYSEAMDKLESLTEEFEDASSEHKQDVAMHSATFSGTQQGMDALDEAGWVLHKAWQQYYAAKAEFQAGLEAAGMTMADIPSQEEIDALSAQLDILEQGVVTIQQQLDQANALKALSDEVEQLRLETDSLFEAYYSAEAEYQEYKERYEAAEADGTLEEYELTAEELERLKTAAEESEAAYQESVERLNALSAELPPEPMLSAALNSIPMLSPQYDMLQSQLQQGRAGISQLQLALSAKLQMQEAYSTLKSSQYLIDVNVYEVQSMLDELEEEETVLAEEKDGLDSDYDNILALSDEADYIRRLEGSMTSAKAFMLRYKDIKARYTDGCDIVSIAGEVAESLERESVVKLISRILMSAFLIAASLGFFMHIPAAFERIKSRPYRITTVLFGMIFSFIAYLISTKLDITDMYAALVSASIALIQFFVVIPEGKNACS